jgi:hypothetical protein
MSPSVILAGVAMPFVGSAGSLVPEKMIGYWPGVRAGASPDQTPVEVSTIKEDVSGPGVPTVALANVELRVHFASSAVNVAEDLCAAFAATTSFFGLMICCPSA